MRRRSRLGLSLSLSSSRSILTRISRSAYGLFEIPSDSPSRGADPSPLRARARSRARWQIHVNRKEKVSTNRGNYNAWRSQYVTRLLASRTRCLDSNTRVVQVLRSHLCCRASVFQLLVATNVVANAPSSSETSPSSKGRQRAWPCLVLFLFSRVDVPASRHFRTFTELFPITFYV